MLNSLPACHNFPSSLITTASLLFQIQDYIIELPDEFQL
jgi:hypothetical protein